VCNRCWRTRGGRPIRLGNRPRRIHEGQRPYASADNFTTLLGRRHPPGPLRRAGPHTGLSLAEEPESRSNSYLARSFSVFLLLSAILAHFFYVDSVIRPGVTSPETTRSLALGSFFINFYQFIIILYLFAPGLNLTDSRISLGSVEGRKDPEDFPRIRTA
jgi:hypothetical protein